LGGRPHHPGAGRLDALARFVILNELRAHSAFNINHIFPELPGGQRGSWDLFSDRALSRASLPLRERLQMLFPFNAVIMLALESNRVIGLRFAKIAQGGTVAWDEAQLMVSEKMRAFAEATETLMTGGTTAAVLSRYQEHVTANVGRLSRA
jgi:hypothetical protein